MLVELKTVQGVPIELELGEDATVQDALEVLVSNHNYTTATRLMYAGKILKFDRPIGSFPHGSVVIVGNVRSISPARRQSPQTTPQQATEQPFPKASSNVSPRVSPRGTTLMRVALVIPAANKRLEVVVRDNAILADIVAELLAREPSLVGCRLVYNGKLLTNLTVEARSVGINGGSVVHVVSASTDPKTIVLMHVEEKLAELTQRVGRGPLSEKEKKGCYEDAMKLLIRLDDVEPSDEIRDRRKKLVRGIQRFQDSLGLEGAEHN